MGRGWGGGREGWWLTSVPVAYPTPVQGSDDLEHPPRLRRSLLNHGYLVDLQFLFELYTHRVRRF